MHQFIVFAALILAAASAGAAGPVYECTDAQGNDHFGDVSCSPPLRRAPDQPDSHDATFTVIPFVRVSPSSVAIASPRGGGGSQVVAPASKPTARARSLARPITKKPVCGKTTTATQAWPSTSPSHSPCGKAQQP